MRSSCATRTRKAIFGVPGRYDRRWGPERPLFGRILLYKQRAVGAASVSKARYQTVSRNGSGRSGLKPEGESYKFYDDVEPCLSIVFRKGAAAPRARPNRKSTMRFVPGKFGTLAAESRVGRGAGIVHRARSGQRSDHSKCKRGLDIGNRGGICWVWDGIGRSALRDFGPCREAPGRTGGISTFPPVTVPQYY